MIPKILHYCWFGNQPLPELSVKCIESWKRYFSDYEIKEWNESNFDLSCCDYVKEAYVAKKWAFVSDYARFWILYRYGGLYFDTDVEIIKPIDDLIAKGSFMGCEPCNPTYVVNGIKLKAAINPGLGMAAALGLSLYKEVLDDYESDHFIMPEKGGPFTIVERLTKILLRYGFSNSNDIQLVEGVYIYPPEYFCPLNYNNGELTITENTRSIHHYVASWYSGFDKKIMKIQQKYAANGKAGCKAERIRTLPLRVRNKMERLGLKKTIIFAFSKLTKRECK